MPYRKNPHIIFLQKNILLLKLYIAIIASGDKLTLIYKINSVSNCFVSLGFLAFNVAVLLNTFSKASSNKTKSTSAKPSCWEAASNNSVEDVRRIIMDSKFKSLDSKYKIYIIDECHSLSNSAWQAMLKLLEEPPKSTVFIFCTTDPQKIPGTILSRVQRYNFQRISKDGIVKRLLFILHNEWDGQKENAYREGYDLSFEDVYGNEVEIACEYIAKQAQGGMRDAITTLDKCLAYTTMLTIENVVKVLSAGVTPYELDKFTLSIIKKETDVAMSLLNDFYMTGVDMSLLLNMYFEFLLNIQKYLTLNDKNVSNLPPDILDGYCASDSDSIRILLQKLYGVITAPKMDIKSLLEAWVIERCLS